MAPCAILREMVRAGAFAAEHPAVGVEEERDRAFGDVPFEDTEAVGPPLVPGQVDLAPGHERPGRDGLGGLGSELIEREGHGHDLPPAVQAVVQVVDE